MKYFPDQRVEKPEPWTPTYMVEIQGQGGPRQETMPLDKLRQTECPVSILSRHPSAIFLLSEVTSAMAVQQTTGGFTFGLDSGKWPCRWYDAIALVNAEDERVETERDRLRNLK